MLAGSAAYSLDSASLRRNPGLARRMWFRWGGGSLKLPLSPGAFRKLALAVLAFVLVFNVGFYNYYRGSVLTPYHKGPVGAGAHHFTLSDATLLSDGGVRFAVYLDEGDAGRAGPHHAGRGRRRDGGALATWDWRALSALAPSDVANDFAYNRFKPAPYGLEARVGAKAVVTLPLPPAPTRQGWPRRSASPTWTARRSPVICCRPDGENWARLASLTTKAANSPRTATPDAKLPVPPRRRKRRTWAGNRSYTCASERTKFSPGSRVFIAAPYAIATAGLRTFDGTASRMVAGCRSPSCWADTSHKGAATRPARPFLIPPSHAATLGMALAAMFWLPSSSTIRRR